MGLRGVFGECFGGVGTCGRCEGLVLFFWLDGGVLEVEPKKRLHGLTSEGWKEDYQTWCHWGGPDTRQSTAAATRYTRVDNNDYLGENPGGTLGAAGLLVDPSLPGVVSCQALPHHRGGEASHEGFLSTKQAC